MIVITGSNSGIGLEAAKIFLAKGAKVALGARSTTEIDSLVALHSSSAIGMVCDIRRPEDCQNLMDLAIK